MVWGLTRFLAVLSAANRVRARNKTKTRTTADPCEMANKKARDKVEERRCSSLLRVGSLEVVGGADGYEGWPQAGLREAEPVLIFEVTADVDVVP